MATLPIQVPAGSAGEAYLRGCLVVMVEPAQDWDGDDLPSDLLDGSGDRGHGYPLTQALVGTGTIEIGLGVLPQNAAQLALAEDHDVVQTFTAHGAEKSLADGIEIGRVRRDLHNLDLSTLGHGGKPLPELVVVVPNEVPRPRAVWCGLPQLLGGPCVGGTAGHVEMDDFPCAVNHEEEGEDRTEEHVVELQEVFACLLFTIIP